MFELLIRATEAYERYLHRPDYHQRKQAIAELRKALDEAARTANKHRRILKQTLEMNVLASFLGEVLSHEGIEELAGRRLAEGNRHSQTKKWHADDELATAERSSLIAPEMPELLVSLFTKMATALDSGNKPPTGGRPIKHLYRHFVAVQLANHWKWFFTTRPTTAPTGQFAKFCLAVFDALECDATGFEKSLPDILEDAMTVFAPNRRPRSRRKPLQAK